MTGPVELAATDVRDGLRERTLYAVVGVFVLLGGGIGYLYGNSPGQAASGIGLAAPLVFLYLVFLPLTALSITYESVVGKRADGSLKLLLGLPYSRADVVAGTYLGRYAVVLAAALAGLVAAHLVALAMGAPVDVALGAGLFGLLTLLALAFVGLAIGLSTVTRSTTRAAAGAFGLFLLAFGLWDLLVQALVYVASGFRGPGSTPEWANVVANLNPLTAYRNAVAGVFPRLADNVLSGGGASAFYEEPGFAVLVLVAWGVLVPLGGYLRFRGADL